MSFDSQLQIFSLGPSGGLTLLDRVSESAGFVARHPSGCFVYLSEPGRGIVTYAVASNRRLQATANVSQGGGPIVVTVPPS